MSKYSLLLISFVLIFTSYAQEIRSSLKTKRLNEARVQFRGYHENLLINDFSNGYLGGVEGFNYKGYTLGKLHVLREDEVVVRKFNPLYLKHRGNKYARSLIFKENRLGILNTHVGKEKVSIYIKDYDYDLSNSEDPVRVLKTNLEIDEETLGFGRNISQTVTDVHYDKVSKTSLVELYVVNSEKRSFLTLMVLGENYEEIARVTIPSNDHKKYVELVNHRILENGEVLTVIQERDGYGDIHSYSLLHIATDGSNNHRIKPIAPAKERIIQSEISKNSYQDNIIVSIFSTEKDRKGEEGIVTAYKYNLKSGKIDHKTYTLNRSDVASAYRNNMEMLGKSEIHFLDDGSVLFALLGDGRFSGMYKDKNIVVFKVDSNGEFQWVNKIERYAKSHQKLKLTGYLYYFNGEGDVEIIFNSSKSAFRKGTYSPRLTGKEDYFKSSSSVKPTKAKINLETGELEIYRIKFPSDINSFSLSSARKMDENGVYKILHYKGTDSYFSIVDFKE